MKKFALTIISTLVALSSMAQLKFATETNYDFIRDALRPCVRVVRSSYFVTDREITQRYASPNDSVFSTEFSVAYAVPQGLIVTESAIKPWMHDPMFDEYRESNEYQALLNDRTFTTVSEAPNYQPVQTSEGSFHTPIETSDSTLYVMDVLGINDSTTIECIELKGDIDGFIAWFVETRDMNLFETSDLNIKITQTNLVFNDGNTAVESPKTPRTMGKILGGLFVVPVTERAGVIEFKIAGFVVPNPKSNSHVTVYKAVVPQAEQLDLNIIIESENDKTELTPIE